MSETDILIAFEDAIINYPNYTVVWDKQIYYSDVFELNGTANRGACPFVMMPNGVESDIRGVTDETYQAAFQFNMWVATSPSIVAVRGDREQLWTFSQEVVNACKPLTDIKGIINLELGFGETLVVGPVIVRTIEVTYDSAECKIE